MIGIENIIEKNEYLVYSIINKYCYYFDKDDLYQVGMIGLINAYKNFDDSKNTKFSSYAYFYILGEVKKYIRESNFLKISKELVKLNASIVKAREYLTQKLGYIPSDNDISLFLEIDIKQIEEAELANNLITSLDKEDEEDVDIYNFYGYEEKLYKEELLDLKDAISNLSEFDRKIIEKRYNEGLTQSEISKQMGINQVKVSRAEKDILVRLRTKLM